MAGESTGREELRERIRAAFPDVVFSGQITPAEELTGETEEEFDEERELFQVLHGRKWSQLPVADIKSLSFNLPLLTEEAYRIFLPAWLIAALDDPGVREPMIIGFRQGEPDDQSHRDFMDIRLRPMTSAQKEILRAFCSYCVAVSTSKIEREGAQDALEYVSSI